MVFQLWWMEERAFLHLRLISAVSPIWRGTADTNELWPSGPDSPLRTAISSLLHTDRVRCRTKATSSYKKESLLCLSYSKGERSCEAIEEQPLFKILPLPKVQTWGPVLWKPTSSTGKSRPSEPGDYLWNLIHRTWECNWRKPGNF